jgi:GNAT superfamily N-acetyltransferase
MSKSTLVRVRPVVPSDEARWRELWQGYLVFYEKTLAAEVTAFTWKRILDPTSTIKTIVAESDGEGVVGIANYLWHENTWTAAPICCLEDLFVDPAWRGRGIGRQLIDWLVDETRRRGWGSLYWHTHQDNHQARALYDQYTPHSGFLRYVIAPKPTMND